MWKFPPICIDKGRLILIENCFPCVCLAYFKNAAVDEGNYMKRVRGLNKTFLGRKGKFDARKWRHKWKAQIHTKLPKLARMVDKVWMVTWMTPTVLEA